MRYPCSINNRVRSRATMNLNKYNRQNEVTGKKHSIHSAWKQDSFLFLWEILLFQDDANKTETQAFFSLSSFPLHLCNPSFPLSQPLPPYFCLPHSLPACKNSPAFNSGWRRTLDKELFKLEILQLLDNLYANQSITDRKKSERKVRVKPWVINWFIKIGDL